MEQYEPVFCHVSSGGVLPATFSPGIKKNAHNSGDGTRIQKSEPGPVPPSVGFDQYRPGFHGYPGSRVPGVTCTVCSTLVFERREWSSGEVARRCEAGQYFISSLSMDKNAKERRLRVFSSTAGTRVPGVPCTFLSTLLCLSGVTGPQAGW